MRYQKGTFTVVPNKEVLRGLDPQTQVLYHWLCDYANDRGLCHPSIGRLANDCGMSRRTTIDRLDFLEKKGLITRIHRATNNGDKDTNLYQLQLVEAEGGSAGDAPPSAGDAQGVVQEMHEGSAGDAHRTQPNELNPIQLNGGVALAARPLPLQVPAVSTPAATTHSFFDGVVDLQEGRENEAIRSILALMVERTGLTKRDLWAHVQQFTSYWTERDKLGRHERWQLEKTFEVDRRFASWLRRAAVPVRSPVKPQVSKYKAGIV